jgi:hypothetical protein
MTHWAIAFALSLVLEAPIYWAMLRLPWRRRWGVAIGVTALTHPYVWFVLPELLQASLGYWGYVAVAEVLVVGVEAWVCWGAGETPKRSLLAAFVANAFSFSCGLVLMPLLW